MTNFFIPYLGFLYGAAYNIQQTLEGSGITSSNFVELGANGEPVGSYWSPSEAVLMTFSVLIIYTIILVLLLIVSGYVLGRWKGIAISLLVILMPGILHTIGYWPDINYMPYKYIIGGTGVLGSINGFIPILIMALLSGWSLMIIAFDQLGLGEKFRNYFDHFWYCSAIIAGVFFVYDAESSKIDIELKEENQQSRNASLYLLDQVKNYYSYCKDNHITEEKISCEWASSIQQKLGNYATYDEKIFFILGPKSSQEIYHPIWQSNNSDQIIQIRKEIKAYNEFKCPTPSAECQSVPAIYCTSFPDPPDDLVDRYIISQTLALASECIIPSLVRSRTKQENLSALVRVDALNQHIRWLFFIIFALFAGGKVANVSTKVAEIDKREFSETQRVYRLLLKILTLIRYSVFRLTKIIHSLVQRLNQSG